MWKMGSREKECRIVQDILSRCSLLKWHEKGKIPNTNWMYDCGGSWPLPVCASKAPAVSGNVAVLLRESSIHIEPSYMNVPVILRILHSSEVKGYVLTVAQSSNPHGAHLAMYQKVIWRRDQIHTDFRVSDQSPYKLKPIWEMFVVECVPHCVWIESNFPI